MGAARRDAHDLTHAGRALRGGLAVATLVAAAGIPLHLTQLEVVSLASPNLHAEHRAMRLDTCAFVLAVGELATLALCALLFARWTARLCDASTASGVTLSTWARRMAVGSWLLPVVQLVRPPRLLASLVGEVYAVRQAVVPPSGSDAGYREVVRRGEPPPRMVIGAWWALWIASRVAEAGATLLGGRSLQAFQVRLTLDVVADALLVCAGMMAQVVVGEVEDAMRAP